MKKPSQSLIDSARWSTYEHYRDRDPVLKGDFSYMRPQDGERYALGAAVAARSVIKALGGDEKNVNSYNDGHARFIEIKGDKECTLFINWAGKHKPKIIDAFVKEGILPELSVPAQQRNATAQAAPAPQKAGVKPSLQSKTRPAIHFATWSLAEKNGEPVLVATFSAHGKTEGTKRYEQAKLFFKGLESVDQGAIADHPPALSIEIRGKKACNDFLAWVKQNAPEQSAAIEATGIGEPLAEPVKKPAPPAKAGDPPPQQLSLDDSWAASVKPSGKPKPKGRGK